MGIITTIIVGIIVGSIAKFIMPGKNEPQGFVMTAILGIVGSFVGSYIGQALNWYPEGGGASWIMSIVGAMIVLLVYGMVTKNRAA